MRASLLEMLRIVKPGDVKAPFAPFHEELKDILQDATLHRVCLQVPRRHAKSTIAARAFPLWHCFEEDRYYGRRQGRKYVILASRTRDLAIDHLDWIKDVLRSPAFKYHYGDWDDTTAQEWTRHNIVLKNGTRIATKGMGQHFVGMNYRGLRPTLILLDDTEDETNTASDYQLERNFEWLIKSVEPSVDPEGRIVFIGTPKHRKATLVRLAAPESGYTTVSYSAILEENTPRERALWPDYQPLERLKKDREAARRRGALNAWIQEWMCRVTGASSGFTGIKYWDGRVDIDARGSVYLIVEMIGGPETAGDPEAMRRLPAPMVVPVNCYLGCDPAIGKSRRSDPSVVVVRGYDHAGRHWTVDVWGQRGATVTQTAEELLLRAWTYNVQNAAAETTAYQDALRQRTQELCQAPGGALLRRVGIYASAVYRRTLPGRLPWLRTFHVPGLENKNNPSRPKKGDNSRLENLQPDVATGRTYLRASHTALRDEMLDYPNGEDHYMDAYYYTRLRSWEPLHTADMLRGEDTERRRTRTRQERMRALRRRNWKVP